MNRIKFNDSASDSGAYTVSLNPKFIDMKDSDTPNIIPILDGGSAIQVNYFDSRPRLLRWERVPGNLANFPTLISTLRGYKRLTKFVKYADIDYIGDGTAWYKYLVADVKVTIDSSQKGGLPLKYSIEVILLPED